MVRKLFPVVFFIVALGLMPRVSAQQKVPDPADFVTVQKGTLPIIVSSPHGGRRKVPEVPERKGAGIANFATVLDANTAEMTEKFAADLEKHLDGKPWVVIARFERKYLDVNRPPELSYESEKAKPYYDAYHGPLEAACKAVKEKFGRGLLLDIHGQGEFPGAICRGTQNGKTVKLMTDQYGWEALTGRRSFLCQLEQSGYKILPSCNAAPKTKEETRFNGGYTVSHYGSDAGYGIDAIQLEFGIYLRERDKSKHLKTASDLADAVAVFYDAYLKD